MSNLPTVQYRRDEALDFTRCFGSGEPVSGQIALNRTVWILPYTRRKDHLEEDGKSSCKFEHI